MDEEARMSEEKRRVCRRLPTGETLHEDGSIVFEEFPEGDPRRGPHSLTVQVDAELQSRTKGRWHRLQRHIDWFAIRLTVGRGYTKQEAGRLFGIGRSHISDVADRLRWVFPMADADRRELSVLVWLAGVKWIDPACEKSREALKRASEWRRKHVSTLPVWQEKERQGDRMTFTINDEIPDDAYLSEADPQRDERQSVLDELQARLRGLEAEWEREAAIEQIEEAGDQHRDGEGADQVGDVARRMDDAIGGAVGVAGMGEAEPASS
jgi:hypothetical protein